MPLRRGRPRRQETYLDVSGRPRGSTASSSPSRLPSGSPWWLTTLLGPRAMTEFRRFPYQPRRSSELHDGGLETPLAEIGLDPLHLVLIVVRTEADAKTHRLVGHESLLDRRFPAGECEPCLQVFGVRLRRKRAGLKPEFFAALRTLRR